MITHDLLDAYESVKGDYDRLPCGKRPDEKLWEAVDGLLLDLHLAKHGYARAGYEKFLEKELNRLCADDTVVERLRGLEL
ncbi:MAG TPA: hypothetical protein PKJ19_00980 [Flavobacteriales bacterium]|nr:hypothetical protein [Flavobacteriales bacterium]HNU57572.1 hypothetical protein [Flavobacteriales bacterium]